MRQLLPFIILILLMLAVFVSVPLIAGEIEYRKWEKELRKERTNDH